MRPAGFHRVYQAGVRDDSGRVLGGTEVMHLVPHRGRLYAALSTARNAPLPGDPEVGAQVVALDRERGAWRVDREYEVAHWRMTLESVTFTRDGSGRALAAPAALLLAGPSDKRGDVYVDSRDDRSGEWTRMHLGRGSGSGVGSTRSFHVYRDKVTGDERVFAGTLQLGICSGVYAPDAPGQIRWASEPELTGYTRRAMGFSECNGRLYVAIKPDLYRRVDGEAPRWEKVYTIGEPLIGISSGLRGLRAVARPSGPGQVLLAALEGDRCRVIRIDPDDGFRETVELDTLELLERRWGRRPTFATVAYDDFTAVASPRTGEPVLLAGLGATYSTRLETHPPDAWVEDAWYLVRHADGRYDLRRIAAPELDPMPPLVATRSIAVSPFDPDVLYFGGYDPNAKPARHTAWVFAASIDAALGAAD